MGFLQELWEDFKKDDVWVRWHKEVHITTPDEVLLQNKNQVQELIEENKQLREKIKLLTEKNIKLIE